tara:strand:- start:1105 stop:1569 length:465 start_codon:yes stop_codon:yes gene_type:complete
MALFTALVPTISFGQEVTDPDKVIREVYEVLAGRRDYNRQELLKNLQRGAWEALSYVTDSDSIVMEDLSEAVPDYYRFREKEAIVKLINPSNYNEYGLEATIPYKVTAEGEIELIDTKTGGVKEKWKIIYLDANYLALDMGELRVFFTHTPVQE